MTILNNSLSSICENKSLAVGSSHRKLLKSPSSLRATAGFLFFKNLAVGARRRRAHLGIKIQREKKMKKYKTILLLLILSTCSIHAAVMWQTSIGYLGNIPGAFLGMSLSGYRYEGVGYHLDIKTNSGGRQGRDNYYDNIYVGEFDDPLKAESESYLLIDAGITRRLFSDLYILGGGGISFYDKYLKYKDPMGILGDSDDEYWIHDDEETEVKINLTAALTYIFKSKGSQSFSLTIGGDLEPPGVVIGIGLVF